MTIYFRYFLLFLTSIIDRFKSKSAPFSIVLGQFVNFELNDLFQLHNPRNGYFADPFIFEYDDKLYVLFEEFSFAKAKGVIALGEIVKMEIVNVRVVLEEEFHLSFPFVFTHNGELFLIPETASVGEVRLYRAKAGPSAWEFFGTLLSGARFVDTVVFSNNNELVLLTTFDSSGRRRSQAELHLFKSKDLNGPWLPSEKNPVLVDNRYGRNAGFLRIDERIYRCSQSFENYKYGMSLNIHEILDTCKDQYLESRPISIFKGRHHLSVLDSIFVSDLRIN